MPYNIEIVSCRDHWFLWRHLTLSVRSAAATTSLGHPGQRQTKENGDQTNKTHQV